MSIDVEAEIQVWHSWSNTQANATLLKTFNTDELKYPEPEFCTYEALATTIDFSIDPVGVVGG